ncbi:peroxiredoxin family protein [Atrimonas thermophila]|uniref:peroxiredoxin family protein n=1 Tax=Atrimonas thermophila TaxID=3064161 RepID=UPI00399C4BC3
MKCKKFATRKFVEIAGLLLMLVLLSGCLSTQPPSNQTKLAEDFTLPALEGGHFTLSEHFGQPILLYFFSTTCHYCQEETPNLVTMYNTYQSAGLLVVGVAVNVNSVQELRNFVKNYGITYPILIDEDEEVSESYGVYYIPHHFFINRDGEIVDNQVGLMSEAELEERILDIL